MFSKGVYVTTTEFGPYLCFPLTKHSSFEAMLIHSPLWEGDGLRRRASPRLLYQSDGTPETHTLKNTHEKIPAAQQAETAQGWNPKGQSRKLRGGDCKQSLRLVQPATEEFYHSWEQSLQRIPLLRGLVCSFLAAGGLRPLHKCVRATLPPACSPVAQPNCC